MARYRLFSQDSEINVGRRVLRAGDDGVFDVVDGGADEATLLAAGAVPAVVQTAAQASAALGAAGAWNAVSSGAWRPAAIGALPRLFVSGGTYGGTWALSYRNAAGAVTSEPAETVAAGVTDVSPVFLDDATEISVAITGTVTVEVK